MYVYIYICVYIYYIYMYILYIYIYIYIEIKYVLQPLSGKVLNATNRTIYIYFRFLTKTAIIDHYTVFHGLIVFLKTKIHISK